MGAGSGEVVSKDGTRIAFDRVGQGPPLILVVGALCSRALGPGVKLTPALAERFTVYGYDRRGRGASGDAPAYDVAREIEDLEALVREAGGRASVFGHSSGAVLALDAAARGVAIDSLALYEPPLVVDASRATTEQDWRDVEAAIADGRRGDAVKAFMRSVGIPAMMIAVMRFLPVWSKLVAVAHTLPYDGRIVASLQRGRPLPLDRWASVVSRTLVIDGGKSPAWMRAGNEALARLLPSARHLRLAGQTHDPSAKVLVPVLIDHFGPRASS